MRSVLLVLLLLSDTATLSVAASLTCPDLAAAIQVGSCPTEAELQYTFTGYCSDNARMYETDDTSCTSFENYRRLKNIALWESADGKFQGYLSCDLPVTAITAAKPVRIAVHKKDRLTRLVCSYPDGISFVHRARQECTLPGDGNCATDPAACRAHCN